MDSTSGLIQANEDGTCVIAIDYSGYPGGEAIVPAPMCSEAEIEAKVEEAKKGFWLLGYYIESVRRVRNPAFDEGTVKTSTKITFRACKNGKEAEFVLMRFKEIVSNECDES